MKKSLRRKLSLMFFIFIAIPLITLGIFSYFKTLNSTKKLTEGSLTQITEKTAISINLTVESLNKYIQTLSLDKDFANIANGDDKLRASVYQYLSILQKNNSDTIDKLLITDTSGKGIISSNDEHYALNLGDRDYVQQALNGEGTQSDLIFSKALNKPVIAIAYPLKVNNKVVGTIVGTILFEEISNLVADIKVGQNGYAYLINKSGFFVYHSESDKILNENIGDTDNSELKSLVDKMKAGETSGGFYTYKGERKLVRFTPVDNWIVVLTANYDDYMAPVIAIRNNTILIAVISLLIAMLLAQFFTRENIIKPIMHLENLMTKAGEGDLTVKSEITTKDEIQNLGENFNIMIKYQADIIRNIRNGAEELAADSEEMSASTEEISSSTEQIAENIQNVASNAENQNNSIVEISEVLVQLSSLVEIAQRKSFTAKENSENTVTAAKQGRSKVKETVDAIQNINKASTETEAILMVLNELSKQVSGIITTINSISTQTNLLSLNAAIEAARAGEHGKGFTVVADEVRKLSEQTSLGANEISSLIKEMVTQIDNAVDSMHLNKQVVDHGVVIANETDASFVTIITAVEQISKDINHVVDATNDEVKSSHKIVKLIDSVATITEITSTSSQEVSASAQEQISVIETLTSGSEETTALANTLNSLVEKFII